MNDRFTDLGNIPGYRKVDAKTGEGLEADNVRDHFDQEMAGLYGMPTNRESSMKKVGERLIAMMRSRKRIWKKGKRELTFALNSFSRLI